MKSKKAYTHPFTELHFISTLELNQSVQLMSNVAYPYPITLIDVNPNTVEFDIQYDNGKIEGTLQHWQGNETRINCAGDVSRVVQRSNSDSLASNLIVVLLIFSLSLLCSQQVALGIIAIVLLMITTSWLQHRDPQIVPIFRERDAIFQEIIDTFKANGEVASL
jgi:hypothetical protein